MLWTSEKFFYVFEIGENDVLCKFCDYLMAFLYVAILILVLLLFFIIIFYKVQGFLLFCL